MATWATAVVWVNELHQTREETGRNNATRAERRLVLFAPCMSRPIPFPKHDLEDISSRNSTRMFGVSSHTTAIVDPFYDRGSTFPLFCF